MKEGFGHEWVNKMYCLNLQYKLLQNWKKVARDWSQIGAGESLYCDNRSSVCLVCYSSSLSLLHESRDVDTCKRLRWRSLANFVMNVLGWGGGRGSELNAGSCCG